MMPMTLLLVLLIAALTIVVTASTPPAAGDASLLQSGVSSHAYSAVTARASLHAGERASSSRFHSMTDRVGIDVHTPQHAHASAPRGRQSRQHEAEQQIMLDIVSKVLASPAQQSMHSTHDGSAAESAEEEFHLLNALMEKQSELREYAKDSPERDSIGGVSRKFLKEITDNAIKGSVIA
ncbi:MAG: hypothetical protein Q7T57_09010 [Dehalococcoidales bacterium]|nr:hypothetical protein [Dehalococcoidales bacterium]